MLFKIKILDKLYEIKSFTIGEARLLRKHFDLRDLTAVNAGDPETLAGLAYICFKRDNPEMPHEALEAKVDALDLEADFAEADDDSEETPTKVATPRAKAGS